MNLNVKIFILNWNGGETLIKCLKSVCKIKYSDFKLTSSQISCTNLNFNIFLKLLKQNSVNKNKPIRLLGLGVNFNNADNNQLNLDIF